MRILPGHPGRQHRGVDPIVAVIAALIILSAAILGWRTGLRDA